MARGNVTAQSPEVRILQYTLEQYIEHDLQCPVLTNDVDLDCSCSSLDKVQNEVGHCRASNVYISER